MAAGLGEIAVLSTCNRTELYATVVHASGEGVNASAPFVSLLAHAAAVPEDVIAPHVYVRVGAAAVEFLCRVAAGLDSMVVGETEILGQVGLALGIAAECGTAGRVLDAAFHTALRAGRRARAETGISRRCASVASETASVVRDRLSAHTRPDVLVLGTGTMGRAVTRVLHGADFCTVRTAGRTPGRARAMAEELGVEAVRWDAVEDSMTAADAVVVTTAAREPTVTTRMVRDARQRRVSERPLVIVDIAVPRNVEPSAGVLAGVELHDLDYVQARIRANVGERRSDIPRVEQVISDEVARFEEWRRGTEMRPVLAALRAKGEEIRVRTLERYLGGADADPALRDRLDALSRDLVTRLLHEPSRRLRAEADPARSIASAEIVRELFDLPFDRAPATHPAAG